MWRVIAVFLFFDKFSMSRSLLAMGGYVWSSEGYVTRSVCAISDAGPNKIGAALLNNNGEIICYTRVASRFKDPNNKYQCVREYMGELVGMMLVSTKYPNHEVLNVKWINDNATAVK